MFVIQQKWQDEAMNHKVDDDDNQNGGDDIDLKTKPKYHIYLVLPNLLRPQITGLK